LIAEPFEELGNIGKLVDADDEQINRALDAGEIHLTERQAQAILDLRLQRLTALEADKLREEARGLRDLMARLRQILADDETLMNVIVEELEAVRDEYGNHRRTEITGEVGVYTEEDLIAEEDVVVTLSHLGYIKRTPLTEYRAQKRGGRGVAGTDTKAEDFVERLFAASTHDYLLVFTNQGKVYWVKVFALPQGGRTARGRPLVNMVQLSSEEKVTAILPVREFTEGSFVITCSRFGTVKKTPLPDYSRPRASGIIGAGINEGDEIIAAAITTDDNDVLIGTRGGMAIRFRASDIRAMGRPSTGVRGIRLDADDEVVGMAVLGSGSSILTVTDRGYGKRTRTEDFRGQGRGGRGIIAMKLSDRNGHVVGVRQVVDGEHVMIITNKGSVIRLATTDVSLLGRNTQGVRMVRLGKGDRVQALCNVAEGEQDEEAVAEGAGTVSAADVEAAAEAGAEEVGETGADDESTDIE
jgi:DNA gyrase subunit A